MTKDLSGWGNHGTLVNGPTWTTGKVGKCLSFDGVDDYVNISKTEFAKGISGSFTIEMWIYPLVTHEIDPESTSGTSGVNGQKYVISPTLEAGYSNDSGHAGAGISVGTNGISVYEHANSYLPALLVWQGTLSGWNNITIVYTNNQPRLYVNGQLVRTGLQSTKTVHPSLEKIGGDAYGYFNGLIDEVRIYSRTLSATEIQNHYLNPYFVNF